MDPWCTLLEWPLDNFAGYYNHYIPDVDLTDEMYFKNRITDITSFPIIPYHDGAFYNDGMKSRSGDVMSIAEEMGMAPNGGINTMSGNLPIDTGITTTYTVFIRILS